MILSTMSGIRYVEHENLNSYRNYPFSETADLFDTDGAVIAADVFVDAMVYPVVESPTEVRLLELDCVSGAVTLEYGSGDNLSGRADNGIVDLYDALGRHAGTLVCGPGWKRELDTGRRRMFNNLWLSPSTCCPVVHKGVISMTDEDRTWRTTRKHLVMVGDDAITPVLTHTGHGAELRFDAQFTPDLRPKTIVNQIVLAVTGQTIFDVAQVDDGTVEVYADGLDREDICWQAHKEDDVAVVVDACEDQEECVTPSVSVKAEFITVCPTDVGNISLVADDMVNYRNPLKITPVEGESVAPRPQVVSGMTREEIFAEAQKMLERPVTVGNGLRISIPGLMNGK